MLWILRRPWPWIILHREARWTYSTYSSSYRLSYLYNKFCHINLVCRSFQIFNQAVFLSSTEKCCKIKLLDDGNLYWNNWMHILICWKSMSRVLLLMCNMCSYVCQAVVMFYINTQTFHANPSTRFVNLYFQKLSLLLKNDFLVITLVQQLM